MRQFGNYFYLFISIWSIILGISSNSYPLIYSGIFYGVIHFLTYIPFINNFLISRFDDREVLKNEYIKKFPLMYYWSFLIRICQVIFFFYFCLNLIEGIVLINEFPELFLIFIFILILTILIDFIICLKVFNLKKK